MMNIGVCGGAKGYTNAVLPEKELLLNGEPENDPPGLR